MVWPSIKGSLREPDVKGTDASNRARQSHRHQERSKLLVRPLPSLSEGHDGHDH